MANRRNSVDLVYTYLIDEIVSMRLPPNTPIVEQEIAYKLNISRTPVREALKRLESTGLVTCHVNQGTFVSPVSVSDIEEICDLRAILELWGLEKSIYRITDYELNRVESNFHEAVRENSPRLFQEADASLHLLIITKTGSVRLKNMIDNLGIQIARFRASIQSLYTNWEDSFREHMIIMQGIRRKDLPFTTECLSSHLNLVKWRYINTLRDTIITGAESALAGAEAKMEFSHMIVGD